MVIKRYLSNDNLDRMINDFRFLINGILPTFYGEISLELRDDYFNLYCRGNSLSKVEFLKNGDYKVNINDAFYNNSLVYHYVKKYNIPDKQQGKYHSLKLNKKQLHPFFQRKHLIDLCQRIKDRNFGEELIFEQMVISSNMYRNDMIIIDRQITDESKPSPGRMDLLVLRRVEEKRNKFEFQIIEGKIGKNTDLKFKVIDQLKRYQNHIVSNFDVYKKCYEENYRQKYHLGLIDNTIFPNQPNIDIVGKVKGMVMIIGYYGKASQQLSSLGVQYKSIDVKHFDLQL